MEIAKYKRNIVGGASAAGVGVAGWLLGGGYSLLTNQHGLGIDNLVEVQVVVPNGNSITASAEYNSDLFFAIKVSLSNAQLLSCGPYGYRGVGTTSVLLLHSLLKRILWRFAMSVSHRNFYFIFHISCLVQRNVLTFSMEKSPEVKIVIMNFIDRCKDKKAAIVAAYRHFCIQGKKEVFSRSAVSAVC